MTCLIAGDSIAVGIASVLPCEVNARIGARAEQIKIEQNRHFDFIVLSVGSNNLGDKEESIRSKVLELRSQFMQFPDNVKSNFTTAKKIVWIVPYNKVAADVVLDIAARYNDFIIDLRQFPSADKIHPSDYRVLAAAVSEKVK